MRKITSKRVCASLIDMMVLALANIFLISGFSDKYLGSLILVFIFEFIYFLFRDFIGGQSIGKRLVGLRVVGLDGNPCRKRQLFVRNIPISTIPGTEITIFPVIEFFVMAFSKDGRRLGDRWAKAKVIDLRPQLKGRLFLLIIFLLILTSLAAAIYTIFLARKNAERTIITALEDYKSIHGLYPDQLEDLKIKTSFIYVYSHYPPESGTLSRYLLTTNAPPFPIHETYLSNLKEWRYWSTQREFAKNVADAFNEITLKPRHFYEEGRRLKKEGNLKEAKAQFAQALEYNPNFQDARLSLAYLQKETKDYEGALAQYEKIIKDDPSSAEAYLNTALIYFLQNKFKEGIEPYKLYIKNLPESEKPKAMEALRAFEEEVKKEEEQDRSTAVEPPANEPLPVVPAKVEVKDEVPQKIEEPIKEPMPSPAPIAVPRQETRKASASLVSAVESGDLKTVEDLIKSGSDVNKKTKEGKSALYLAVEKSDKDMVKLLLQSSSVDINAVDHAKLSPLHVAAKLGDLNIVKILVEHGAQTTLIDANGLTPIDHARFNDHGEVYKYLGKASSAPTNQRKR